MNMHKNARLTPRGPPDVLSARMVQVISDLAEDWRRLDERITSRGNFNTPESVLRRAYCQ
jgi:hypothetical protein